MLTAVLEALPDAVVITDSWRRILLANREARRIFGRGSAELRGQPIELLLPDGIPAGGAMGRREDGSEFPVDVRVWAVDSVSGSVRVVCIREATVAHASRNALCVLSCRVDLMLLEAEETGLPPKAREDLGVLQRAVRRLADTFDHLVRITAAPTADHERIDLDGLIEEAPVKRNQKIELMDSP